MSDHFFKVKNRHVENCGIPPEFEGGGSYLSYYENQYREQWVFTLDFETRVFAVWGGDAGWDTAFIGEKGLKSLVMGQGERLWIGACLNACGLDKVTVEVFKAWDKFDKKILSYGP